MPPLLDEDGNESWDCSDVIPRAARPGGTGGACSHLPSCLVAGAACFPSLEAERPKTHEMNLHIPAWKIYQNSGDRTYLNLEITHNR